MVFPRQEHPKMSKTAKMSVFILVEGRNQVQASNKSQNIFAWFVLAGTWSLVQILRGRGGTQKGNK